LALAAATIASSAGAETYRFEVTDPDATLGGHPFTPYYFFLDSSPTLDCYASGLFTLNGTTFGHTFSDVAVMDIYTFHDSANDGGLDDNESYYLGHALFTGDTAHPTFKLGTIALNNFGSGALLTISSVAAVSPVPEPATWAMMQIGVGAVGASARRGKVNTAVSYR